MFLYYFGLYRTYLINIGWFRIRIRMDPELLPGSGSGKFKAGSGSGINHSGYTTLILGNFILVPVPVTYIPKPPKLVFEVLCSKSSERQSKEIFDLYSFFLHNSNLPGPLILKIWLRFCWVTRIFGLKTDQKFVILELKKKFKM